MPRSLAIEQMAKLHLSKVRVVCVRSSLWSCEQTFFALLYKANETRERYPHTKKANWCCTQFQCTMFPFMSYILNSKSLMDRFFFKSSMWPTEKNLLVKASQQLWVMGSSTKQSWNAQIKLHISRVDLSQMATLCMSVYEEELILWKHLRLIQKPEIFMNQFWLTLMLPSLNFYSSYIYIYNLVIYFYFFSIFYTWIFVSWQVCQGRFQGAVVGADLSWRESDTSGIEVKVIKHWRCFQVIG